MVGIGQGPCVVGGGDDCTWLARGLETLSGLIPDKKCEHHGIMLLESSISKNLHDFQNYFFITSSYLSHNLNQQ